MQGEVTPDLLKCNTMMFLTCGLTPISFYNPCWSTDKKNKKKLKTEFSRQAKLPHWVIGVTQSFISHFIFVLY